MIAMSTGSALFWTLVIFTLLVLALARWVHLAGQQPRRPYEINTNQRHTQDVTNRRELTPEERDALIAQAYRDMSIGDLNTALERQVQAQLNSNPLADAGELRARLQQQLGKGR